MCLQSGKCRSEDVSSELVSGENHLESHVIHRCSNVYKTMKRKVFKLDLVRIHLKCFSSSTGIILCRIHVNKLSESSVF